MKRITCFFFLLLLCTGCGMQNSAGDQAKNVTGTAAAVSGAAATLKISPKGKKVVENKKYGISLPEAEEFAEELEELVYWSYATRQEEGESNLYSWLEERKALGRELKVKLYYQEGDKDDNYFDSSDEIRPFYYILAWFPEIQEVDNYVGMWYNARGLVNPDDFNVYDDPDIDDIEDVLSGGEDEEPYTEWGESTIYVDEMRAKEYVPAKDTSKIRQQIERDCLKEFKKYGEYNEEYEIYLREFLPGDQWMEGVVIQCDPKDGDVPIGWVQTHICYAGRKMEKYKKIVWHVRPSTMFNGPEGYSLKAAKEAAKEQREAMLPENCFLAYRIKGDKMTSLKKE